MQKREESKNQPLQIVEPPQIPLSFDQDQIINQQYKIWKKNSPLLYDLLISYQKTWPCLTVEWLPFVADAPEAPDFANTHQMVVGTNISGTQDTYAHIQLVQVNLPKPASHVSLSPQIHSSKIPLPCLGLGPFEPNITVIKRIPHLGDVNRLRHLPTSPNIIAAKGVDGIVNVYDIDQYQVIEQKESQNQNMKEEGMKSSSLPFSKKIKSLSNSTLKQIASPLIRLKGHSQEGFALQWNKTNHGCIASASYDGKICVWDINSVFQTTSSVVKEGATIQPLFSIQQDSKFRDIQDISWNQSNPNILVSVGASDNINIYDIRCLKNKPSQHVKNCHNGRGIMSVDFNKQQHDLLATAGKDGFAALWDLKMINVKIHSFQCYQEDEPHTTFQNLPPEQLQKYMAEQIMTSSAFINNNNLSDVNMQERIRQAFIQGNNAKALQLYFSEKKQKQQEVNTVSWSNFSESILATSGTDRRVRIWDMTRIGNEQSGADQDDGPPELLFIHTGHTAEVSDISWNQKEQLVMASVSEDNLLQIWQMAGEMYFTNECQI